MKRFLILFFICGSIFAQVKQYQVERTGWINDSLRAVTADSLNALRPSIQANLDSISTHRNELNALTDTTQQFRNELNADTDSLQQHRTELNSLFTENDIQDDTSTVFRGLLNGLETNKQNVINNLADTSKYIESTDVLNPAKVTQSASYRFVTDTEKSTWNGKQDAISNLTDTLKYVEDSDSSLFATQTDASNLQSQITANNDSITVGIRGELDNLNSKVDQNVNSGDSPTFTGTNFTGIPQSGVTGLPDSLADKLNRGEATSLLNTKLNIADSNTAGGYASYSHLVANYYTQSSVNSLLDAKWNIADSNLTANPITRTFAFNNFLKLLGGTLTGTLRILSPNNTYPTGDTASITFRQQTNNAYGWDFVQDNNIDGYLHLHRVENNISTEMLRFGRDDGRLSVVSGLMSLGKSGGTSGSLKLIMSDNDQMDITGNTSDQMLFQNASGGYSFDARISGTTLTMSSLPTYADDTAAGAGGLTAGQFYKDSSGIVRVKL